MNYPLPFLGNKTKDIKHFKHLLPAPETIETVCEPFAGSFAVIRCFYKDVKNLKCADNDFNYRKRLKNIFDDLDGYHKEKLRINKILDEKGYIRRKEFEPILDASSNIYFTMDDWNSKGLCKKMTTSFDYKNLKPIYDRIEWFDDFKILMEKYKDDEKAFIFLDPPYFQSNNSYYYGSEQKDAQGYLKDNTYFYIDILRYFQTCKAKLMMVVNEMGILEYIYQGFIKGKYPKCYGHSKNKENLMILTNY